MNFNNTFKDGVRLGICLLVYLFSHHSAEAGYLRLVNGIYLTEHDFARDILTYPSLHESDSLIEQWGGDISIVRNSLKMEFKFGEFYGYRDRGFKFFSFGRKGKLAPHGYYQILDTSGLSIYSKRVAHVQYKYVTAAYFSLPGTDDKHKLTLGNLRKQIPMHTATVDRIKAIRKSGRRLESIVNGRCAVNLVLKEVLIREPIKFPAAAMKE